MKTKIFWLSAVTCHGNVHSFFQYELLERFLEDFEFIYHPSLGSKYDLEEVIHQTQDCDILIIDGTISDDFEKCGVKITQIIENYASVVKRILTVGTCATYGGIFEQSPLENPRGLHFHKTNYDPQFAHIKRKTISLPGCPVHPEILVNTLYAVKKEIDIALDAMLRPKEYFTNLIHHGCARNEYFEYKVDNYQYGKKEGCMYYNFGCQAPFTHGSCNTLLWNGVSSKTRSGSPCFGCIEPSFPRSDLFTTKKHMGIPENLPLGIPKRTYLTFAGIAKAFTIPRLEKGFFDDQID